MCSVVSPIHCFYDRIQYPEHFVHDHSRCFIFQYAHTDIHLHIRICDIDIDFDVDHVAALVCTGAYINDTSSFSFEHERSDAWH